MNVNVEKSTLIYKGNNKTELKQAGNYRKGVSMGWNIFTLNQLMYKIYVSDGLMNKMTLNKNLTCYWKQYLFQKVEN